ncbi:hypothetical protein AAVH_19453 [Aphelenchoides avenae]|nr:hypothetical protein AAVH_19453 [Aphelenchus avenae]
MGSCFSRREDPQTSALVKPLSLPGIVGDVPINRSLPPHDYIQQLIKQFRESSSPESISRVVFSAEQTLCEYASASYHLPGAYVNFFPCPHCTYEDEEERTSFVEVFHFANVHNPDVCATVTFVMPADARRLKEPAGCSVEVEVTKGCPNTPVVDHSPHVVLLIDTDVFIEALRFLPRSEVDKMWLVSRRWSNVIGGAAGSLQQRRSFTVFIKFYGVSPGMLSIHFARQARLEQWRILRVLTTRGRSQSLSDIRSHLRNAFVEGVFPFFLNRAPPPGPSRKMRVDIPLPARINWLESLLRSMPPNSEIGSWCVADQVIGSDNLLTLASCALEPHMKLGSVQRLELGLFNRDATWAAINTAELPAILSSCQSRKLRVTVSCSIEPQDSVLTLPAQIVRDFVALRGVDSFITEFSLHLQMSDKVAFSEMADVDEATDRRKRFRHHLQGKDTVVRVSVYENPTARERLTAVTFDHFRRTVFFLNGNVPLAELKQVFQRPYAFY